MELDWAPAAAGGRGTPVPLGPNSLEYDNVISQEIHFGSQGHHHSRSPMNMGRGARMPRVE